MLLVLFGLLMFALLFYRNENRVFRFGSRSKAVGITSAGELKTIVDYIPACFTGQGKNTSAET